MKGFLGIGLFIFFLTASQAYGGVITGRATFGDAPISLASLQVTKNQEVCGQLKPNEALIISPDRMIANVVVSIEGIKTGKEAPQALTAVLDNRECLFFPHVQAVMKGTRLELRNSDPVLHNTHPRFLDIEVKAVSLARLTDPHAHAKHGRTVFNIALPFKGMKVTSVLNQSGLIHVMCDEHPWMNAYIMVFDHPYFAVTGKDGSFIIRDVPAGRYKLRAWHEALGVQEREITVDEKGEVRVEFTFSLPKEEKAPEHHAHH